MRALDVRGGRTFNGEAMAWSSSNPSAANISPTVAPAPQRFREAPSTEAMTRSLIGIKLPSDCWPFHTRSLRGDRRAVPQVRGRLSSEQARGWSRVGPHHREDPGWNADWKTNGSLPADQAALKAAINCNTSNAPTDGQPGSTGSRQWGQSDMAGNVKKWTLDSFDACPLPCVNCANQAATTQKVARGGAYYSPADTVMAAYRYRADPLDPMRWACAAPRGTAEPGAKSSTDL